jgi:drug/metabolite transporter (DMT)-like permease
VIYLETWQIAALVAMVLLAVYSLAVKQFFNDKQDWRAFIPLAALASFALLAYYIYTGAHSSISGQSYLFALVIGVIFILSTIATFLAIAEGPASVVVPIFSLNLVIVVIASTFLFGEQMTIYKIGGVLLGLFSILLLTLER